MSGATHSAAVFAGLAFIHPTEAVSFAYAESAVKAPLLQNNYDNFFLGFLTGALCVGSVAALVAYSLHKSQKRTAQQELSGDTQFFEALFEEEGKRVPRHLRKAHTETSTLDIAEDATGESASSQKSITPSHEAHDYADIAQNYMRRLTWKEKLSARAKGVKTLLDERMGKDMLDDLPIIARSDGSVADIGTGWWDALLGDSVKSGFEESVAPDLKDGIGSITRADVANSIAARIAHIESGVFPENQNEKQASLDVWDEALANMDAKSEVALIDLDIQESEQTQAEKTPTEVLPFRTPAGHPEVVDTNTYVDYLIRQEFENNSSQSLRKTSRSYLKVLEGGSQSTAPTVFNFAKRHKSLPKHMKHSSALSEKLHEPQLINEA